MGFVSELLVWVISLAVVVDEDVNADVARWYVLDDLMV
jgi:hypothetical protein